MLNLSFRNLGLVILVAFWLLSEAPAGAQAPIFSGPQPGEKLAALPVKGLVGEWSGKALDAREYIGNKPALVLFLHSLTRPAFGMTRGLVKFAESKKSAGLQTVVVFLTADPTETEKWAQILPKQMSAGPMYCYSTDGVEGPGSYGLNRNVILTVLIANHGTVEKNLALVQPQLQADGPEILQALVELTGGGKVPSVAELEQSGMGMRPVTSGASSESAAGQTQLRELLRVVIDKQADADSVKQAAARVEEYVKENAAARQELGMIANRILKADKLSNYGTSTAQDFIRDWSKKYGPVD